MKGKNTSKKMPIRLKIICISLACTLFGMFCLLLTNHFSNQATTSKLVMDKTHLIAKSIALSTDAYLHSYSVMLNMIRDTLNIDTTAEAQRYVKFFDDQMKQNQNILAMTIAFDDGVQFFDTRTTAGISPDFDSRVRPWYMNTQKANAPIVTDTYIEITSGQPSVAFTMPVKLKNGIKGVISIDVAVSNLLKELNTYIDKDLGGRLFVYNTDSDVIVLHNNTDFITKTITEANPALSKMGETFRNGATTFYVNDDGVDTIILGERLNNAKWTVVYVLDEDNLFRETRISTIQSIIISAIIAVIVIIVSLIAITLTLKDLQKFANIMIDAGKNNDLTISIPVESNDELGKIAESMNEFIKQIHHIMQEVSLASVDLSSGNNELAATMEELSATFTSQAQQISDMVGNLESVNETSISTASSMSENMVSLESTASKTNNETEKLGDVSENMNQIQNNTASLALTIDRLAESSREIGNILSVINDIANQTNLLALNAAIEAARAGEAGRGFAVVADEVRKLAERTQHSIGEIEHIITSLQNEAESAASEMAKSTDAVKTGADNINSVTIEIRSAVDEVTALYEKMKPETKALENAQMNVQVITDNALVVASGVEESTSAIGEVNITVGHLQERAEKLKALVERFRI